MWYAAHFLTAHIGEDVSLGVIVEETISLIEANSECDAKQKAEILAARYASTKINYLDPSPGEIKSYGVVKVLEISNTELGNESPPRDETEISYSLLKFKSVEDASKFVEGKEFTAIAWQPDGN